jgi:hypothetical protein
VAAAWYRVYRRYPRRTPFTLDTASKIREKVPHRQMLPSSRFTGVPMTLCGGAQ